MGTFSMTSAGVTSAANWTHAKVGRASVAAHGRTVRGQPALLQQSPGWRITATRCVAGGSWHPDDPGREAVRSGLQRNRGSICGGIVGEEIGDMSRGVVVEAGNEG